MLENKFPDIQTLFSSDGLNSALDVFVFEDASQSSSAEKDEASGLDPVFPLPVDTGLESPLPDPDYILKLSSDVLDIYGSGWFRLGAKNNDTDLLQAATGTSEIPEVNQAPLDAGTWFQGSGGGAFRVFAGGVFDFRNQGDQLLPGDITSFSYTWDDGNALTETTVTLQIDAGDDIASDDAYVLRDSALATAGQSWVRLASHVNSNLLFENDSGVNAVHFVNGHTIEEGVWFDGSNGGQFRVFAGGVVDFRNQGNAIGAGQATGFTYGVLQDGQMDAASVSLTVVVDPGPVLIKGADTYYSSGQSVSSAGDLDGDGLDDIIIGAPGADPDGVVGAGESYVIFGSALARTDGEFDLASLTQTQGVLFKGIDPGDNSGWSVANAGDVDGDGRNDVLISATNADSDGVQRTGESYLIYGSALLSSGGEIDLGALNSALGVLIKGAGFRDNVGMSTSSAGDVDGDGFDDIILSAPQADTDGKARAGETYLIFGSALVASDGDIDLATLTADQGVLIAGADVRDVSGTSVSAAGDLDGDGLDDIIIGAPGADPDGVDIAGENYVIFGSALTATNGRFDLSTLSASQGVLIKGIDKFDFSGASVSSAGDVDGDGVNDVLIGATGAGPYRQADVGETYLIFGDALADADGDFDLATLTSDQGVVIKGVDFDDESGGAVSSAGDVDGDGLDDILVGAPNADPDGKFWTGEAYVIFGSALVASDGEIDLAKLTGKQGVVIEGTDSSDDVGKSVSSAGDVDGDGLDDILVGAPSADPDGLGGAGEVYLIFGVTLLAEKSEEGVIAQEDWFL